VHSVVAKRKTRRTIGHEEFSAPLILQLESCTSIEMGANCCNQALEALKTPLDGSMHYEKAPRFGRSKRG
jgi:hypothetical protein